MNGSVGTSTPRSQAYRLPSRHAGSGVAAEIITRLLRVAWQTSEREVYTRWRSVKHTDSAELSVNGSDQAAMELGGLLGDRRPGEMLDRAPAARPPHRAGALG